VQATLLSAIFGKKSSWARTEASGSIWERAPCFRAVSQFGSGSCQLELKLDMGREPGAARRKKKAMEAASFLRVGRGFSLELAMMAEAKNGTLMRAGYCQSMVKYGV
jgi:hypothetical protein